MQTAESDKKQNKFADEECINFRPSPNFKHMKKYLKSKFEEANSSPNQSSDRSSTPNSEEQEIVKPEGVKPEGLKPEGVKPEGLKPEGLKPEGLKPEGLKPEGLKPEGLKPECVKPESRDMAQRVQPPLPPHSPPPELIVPKQEVVDEEYESAAQQKTEKDNVKPTERVMCRQFARGRCVRGANCIFAHEIIHSQLPDVYTFCKNFQNSNCSFPKCKFVHATVFEKEHYYRTGNLPPHTLAHLKETNSALALPTALEATPADSSQVQPNAPPAVLPCATLPMSGYAPPPAPAPFAGPSPKPASTKRFGNLDQALVPPEDTTLPKKCKTCDASKLRVHNSQTKLDQLNKELEMLHLQKQKLNKKDARLNRVFSQLSKSKSKRQSPGPRLPVTASTFDEARSIDDRVLASRLLDFLERKRGADSSRPKGSPNAR